MKTHISPRPAKAAGPVPIDPRAIYYAEDLERLLGLSRDALRRERRAGRLRVARRLGRYHVLGQWILEWVRTGELPRKSQGE
jgi:hypothetical protein